MGRGRPKIANPEPKKHVGFTVDIRLYLKFSELTRKLGTSINDGIRRLLIDAVNADEIPGLERLSLEDREQEKDHLPHGGSRSGSRFRTPTLHDRPVQGHKAK